MKEATLSYLEEDMIIMKKKKKFQLFNTKNYTIPDAI